MAKNKNKNKNKNPKATAPKNTDPPVSQHGYDPNSTYGRAQTDLSFDEWLAEQGLNQKNLNKARKQRLKQRWQNESRGDWATTDPGEIHSSENPDQYFNYLLGEAGGMMGQNPLMGAPDPFMQWLMTDYAAQTRAGWEMAQMANPDLSYQQYMNSIGWGADANKNALITPPRDTGNPFTSNSMPPSKSAQAKLTEMPEELSATSPIIPTWDEFLEEQGVNKPFKRLNKGRKQRLRNAYAELSNPPSTNVNTPGTSSNDTGGGLDAARNQSRLLSPQRRTSNAAKTLQPGRWSVF